MARDFRSSSDRLSVSDNADCQLWQFKDKDGDQEVREAGSIGGA